MNILCLTDAFWPDHTGGISKSVLSEVEGLVARGNKVVAVSRRLRAGTPENEERQGYNLYRYPGPAKDSPFERLYPLASRFILPRMIKRILRDHRFDIVYVNNVFQADVLIKAACDIPMVYVFHASAHREITIDLDQGKYGRMSWLARVANAQVRRIEKRVISKTQSIIVRSEFMREELDSLYGGGDKSEVQCVPLGVDMERFGYADDLTKVRRELALEEDRPVLLTVRRLVARMGIENLIIALRKVADRFPKVLLVIGGTGYLERELKDLITKMGLERNITMLGFIPENMLTKYYQAADLFVLPTLTYEGFGRSTIEALSCGTPAIVTPVGANPEVMSPLGEEFLFKGIDSKAICNGIITWLEKGVDVESRKQCRSYCFERFSQEKVCGDLEDVLGAVANRHSVRFP